MSESGRDPARFGGEPTTLSLGLILFYLSCAAVGIGAALTAMTVIVFPSASFAGPLAVFGAIVVLAGSVGAWRFLKAARRE